MLLEDASKLRGGLRGAVDEPDSRTKDAPQQRLQKRIVRAPEHQRGDAVIHERREIFQRDLLRDRMVHPAFLDEWDEERTGARADANLGVDLADGALVR